MSELVIRQIPVLKDNYVYLIHEPQSRATGVVDPSVAPPILEAAQREGWRITHILNTHHHNDHTGGKPDAGTQNDFHKYLGMFCGLRAALCNLESDTIITPPGERDKTKPPGRSFWRAISPNGPCSWPVAP